MVDVVVTVVDAEDRCRDTLAGLAEARKQVILADRLIITKTDIAGEGAAETLDRAVARAQRPCGNSCKP